MTKRTQEVSAIAAAQQLGIDPGYLYLQLRAGRITGRKEGRRWLVSVEAIENRKQGRHGQSNAASGVQR
jgi:hypothetical protein